MGTLKDAFTAIIASENWCAAGAKIITDAPDDLQDWYDNTSGAPGFLQVCNVSNPTKAKAMFLQSVLELVAAMPEGEEKTRLDAIGQETATLADERAWVAANPAPVTECKNFIRASTAPGSPALAGPQSHQGAADGSPEGVRAGRPNRRRADVRRPASACLRQALGGAGPAGQGALSAPRG